MGSADESAGTQGAGHGDDGAPILVGIDGSQAARTALLWAAAEARRWGRPLLVVHAFEPPPVRTELAVTPDVTEPWSVEDAAVRMAHREAEAVLGPRNGLKVEVEVVCGPPAQTLVKMSQGAELVVVGSRGGGGFTGPRLGSVSQHVSHHARCPIVIVREPEA